MHRLPVLWLDKMLVSANIETNISRVVQYEMFIPLMRHASGRDYVQSRFEGTGIFTRD
ncbi:hypothetical protein CUJ84_pRLN1001009 (plasmid) [Rhizobium leguminosarum]|uniref:Uncharacterized protein n=1 Tax=Rhizobium leguminosarum TaxID=384 RepID=A0A2K9ZDY1_RHILE|nr:hypothetical protein CUJ84_pRLN1001009 [Rhizobium leguminosarum]